MTYDKKSLSYSDAGKAKFRLNEAAVSREDECESVDAYSVSLGWKMAFLSRTVFVRKCEH